LNKKYILFLFLFSLTGAIVQGQSKLDSVLAYLSNTVKDSTKITYTRVDTSSINTITELIEKYQIINPELAETYCLKGLQLSVQLNFGKGIAIISSQVGAILKDAGDYEIALKSYQVSYEYYIKLNNIKGIADCYSGMGMIYQETDDYKNATLYYEKALLLNKKLGNNKYYADYLHNMGMIQGRKGNYVNGLEYFENALKIYELYKDTSGIANCYYNIGTLFVLTANFDKSLSYYFKCIKLYEEIGLENRIADSYSNIANVYYYKAQYTDAIDFNEKAIAINEKLGRKSSIAGCYVGLGVIYYDQSDFDKAQEYFIKSLKIHEEINDKNAIALSLNNIADVSIAKKDYPNAIIYGEKALSIATEIGSLADMQDAYLYLSKANDSIGKVEDAFNYYKLYSTIKDSILNKDKQDAFIEMEAKYQNEKKEKEILILNEQTKEQELQIEKEQNRKRTQLFIFLASLIVVILTSILFYSRYRSKQKTAMAKAMAEQQKLRFKEVIEAQELERKRIAEDLHDSVGLMLATAKLNMNELEDVAEFKDKEDYNILKNTISIVDESSQEVRNISHNMMPGALIELGLTSALRELVSRLNKTNKTNFILKADGFVKKLDESVEITVYRITQEILGNIIKHANATQVDIEIKNENELVKLHVKDNGVGVDKNKIEKSSGIGWKNIFSRVTMLNGKIDIESEVNAGTSIDISFKC
jgi:two-component system, NarL family, sensor kinase